MINQNEVYSTCAYRPLDFAFDAKVSSKGWINWKTHIQADDQNHLCAIMVAPI